MEFVFKEIVSSTSKVKKLLEKLDGNSKDYVIKAKEAINAYKSLLDSEKSKIMNDIYIKYKYFDGLEAIKLDESIKNVKPVIKTLISLDDTKKNYNTQVLKVLSQIDKLTAMEISILLRNESARVSFEKIKAYIVSNMFLSLNKNSKDYMLNVNKALDAYKNLDRKEKLYLIKSTKVYKAYNLTLVDKIKELLLNVNSSNYGTIGREAIYRYEDLIDEYKKLIINDDFYINRINSINMFFDKQRSEEIIKKLHNVYLASLQSNLTKDYFAYALRVIEEFEGEKESVKRLVKAQAAFELKVAKDGKDAHPIVALAETYLPEKTHSKYYEIVDILVSAYEFGLTKRQKSYFNKNLYAVDLMKEARKEIDIKENII